MGKYIYSGFKKILQADYLEFEINARQTAESVSEL